jgi:hypothetical protein
VYIKLLEFLTEFILQVKRFSTGSVFILTEIIIYAFNLLVKTITLDLRGKMMELTEGQEIKFYLISEAALNI